LPGSVNSIPERSNRPVPPPYRTDPGGRIRSQLRSDDAPAGSPRFQTIHATPSHMRAEATNGPETPYASHDTPAQIPQIPSIKSAQESPGPPPTPQELIPQEQIPQDLAPQVRRKSDRSACEVHLHNAEPIQHADPEQAPEWAQRKEKKILGSSRKDRVKSLSLLPPNPH